MENNTIVFHKTPYDGYYASKNGEVFSTKTKKCLVPKIDKDGYHEYALTIQGAVKYVRGHRIIAETFLPNPENKETVNHIDGNKQNNNVTNLEWSTYSENNHHRFDILHCFKPVKWLFQCSHDGVVHTNLSRKDCEKFGVSGTYLKHIIEGTINKYFLYFDKMDDGSFTTYWNGEIYKKYKNAKEAAKDLGMRINCVYVRAKKHKALEYITKDYKFTFQTIGNEENVTTKAVS